MSLQCFFVSMQVGGLLLSLLISACRLSPEACRQATAVIKVKGDEIACESVSLMLMKGLGAYLRFLKVAVLAVIAIVTTLPSDS